MGGKRDYFKSLMSSALDTGKKIAAKAQEKIE